MPSCLRHLPLWQSGTAWTPSRGRRNSRASSHYPYMPSWRRHWVHDNPDRRISCHLYPGSDASQVDVEGYLIFLKFLHFLNHPQITLASAAYLSHCVVHSFLKATGYATNFFRIVYHQAASLPFIVQIAQTGSRQQSCRAQKRWNYVHYHHSERGKVRSIPAGKIVQHEEVNYTGCSMRYIMIQNKRNKAAKRFPDLYESSAIQMGQVRPREANAFQASNIQELAVNNGCTSSESSTFARTNQRGLPGAPPQ